MKKVLVISYFYPPLGGVGVIRTLKFTKYLPEHGWMPYVLTVKNRDRFYTDCGRDEIPDHVHIYRAWNILNNLSVVEGGLRRIGVHSKVLIPDAYLGWIPMAVKKGKEIIEEEGIDLIYVSCPPHSSSLIGLKLKEITKLPLVIDFRDGWTLNPYAGNYFLNYLKNLDESLERRIFDVADVLILNTKESQKQYVEKYPPSHNKSITITNGFDFADIPSNSIPFTKFTILYTGFFYGSRNPEMFFQALNNLLQDHVISRNMIQFVWAGRSAPDIEDMISKYHLQDITHYLGIIPKKEADSLIYRSHLLLLLDDKFHDRDQSISIPNKLFPYLASGKPILGLISEGPAQDFLKKYANTAYISGSGDPEKIAQIISFEYSKWCSGTLNFSVSEKTNTFRNIYNYKSLTEKLAGVFDQFYK